MGLHTTSFSSICCFQNAQVYLIHKTMLLLLRCALFCELGKPERFESNGLFVDLISLGAAAVRAPGQAAKA